MNRSKWLKQQRISLRLSREQLHDRTGISLTSINHFESGEREIPDGTYQLLKSFFADANKRRGGTPGNAEKVGQGLVMKTATGWYVTPAKAGDFAVRTFKADQHEQAKAYARNPIALKNPYPSEYGDAAKEAA